MFRELKVELLKPENWTGDSDATIKTFMAVLIPNVKKAINKLYQPVVDAEAKYSVIDDQIDGSAYAKEAISKHSSEGIETIERIMLTEEDRFTQSYFQAVMKTPEKPRNEENLKNPLLLPLYSIKTDFIRLCDETLDIVQTLLDGAINNMRRTHDIFHVEPASVRNIPKEFVPVVFPYSQLVLASDLKDMVVKKEDSEFPQHIEKIMYDLQTQLAADMNKQIKAAGVALEATINAATSLSKEIRDGLLLKVSDIISNGDKNIIGARENAADELKKNLPESYNEKEQHFSELLSVTQEDCDDYAKNVNYWGNEVMNDLVNIYDDLKGLVG